MIRPSKLLHIVAQRANKEWEHCNLQLLAAGLIDRGSATIAPCTCLSQWAKELRARASDMPLLGFEILSWLSMVAAVCSIRGYGVALAVGATAEGTLPAVVFVKPDGTNNQHPGESTMAAGDLMAGTIVETLRRSPQWTRMAIIVMRTVASGTLLPRPRRPVGPRLAYPNRHRITIRKERIRGPHDLRHDVDPAIPF